MSYTIAVNVLVVGGYYATEGIGGGTLPNPMPPATGFSLDPDPSGITWRVNDVHAFNLRTPGANGEIRVNTQGSNLLDVSATRAGLSRPATTRTITVADDAALYIGAYATGTARVEVGPVGYTVPSEIYTFTIVATAPPGRSFGRSFSGAFE